jgi:hypothetical protein
MIINPKENFLDAEKSRLKAVEMRMRFWGILILSVITGALTFIETGKLRSFILALVYTSVYWNGNVQIAYWVDRYIKIDENLTQSLLLQGIGMLVFNAVASYFLILLNPYCDMDLFWYEYMGSLRITAFVIVLYNSFFLYNLLRNSRYQYGSLQRAKAELEYTALQNQVNPHFLFNSLNTLQHLIDHSPKQAQEFVERLSLCYRYLLENKGKELVTIQEELDFCKSFIHLLKVRFGEAFHVVWPETDLPSNQKVPPLSLQILIENCIKHNIISIQKPLEVCLQIQKKDIFYICVENNFQPRRQKEASTGTGLQNISKRYSLLSDKAPVVSCENGLFSVCLPILDVNGS